MLKYQKKDTYPQEKGYKFLKYVNTMKYRKIINLLNNEITQPSKFRTKNWVEIKDGARITCDKFDVDKLYQIIFKTAMLKPSFCDQNHTYILVKETITVVGEVASAAAVAADRNDKQVMFKNCAPYTDRTIEVNIIQVDNAKDLNVVMQTHNLIEYSNKCSKT